MNKPTTKSEVAPEVGSHPEPKPQVNTFIALERSRVDERGVPWWTVVECKYVGDKIIERKIVHPEDAKAYAREAYLMRIRRVALTTGF